MASKEWQVKLLEHMATIKHEAIDNQQYEYAAILSNLIRIVEFEGNTLQRESYDSIMAILDMILTTIQKD